MNVNKCVLNIECLWVFGHRLLSMADELSWTITDINEYMVYVGVVQPIIHINIRVASNKSG